MLNQFLRTELLLGKEGMKKLANARVAVFGIGGVGGHTVEALVRSGIGEIDIIDNDEVAVTNINRQIIATHKTVGMAKVDAMEARIHDINPDCVVHKHKCFFLPETRDQFDFSEYDYVVDAVDTVTAKLELVVACKEAGTPIMSSMGAGNKLDPSRFEVADIYKTSVCPLAKVMRRELKKRGIKKLKVVYSQEEAIKPMQDGIEEETNKRALPGSTAFVPSVAGLIIAGEVIKDITNVL
ncbi:MAG: tRNA threonylcarbamoyladenosine dehydratase [Agathobacter sp.]|nr:tRNA threonylcarbamoyladenosine dehydratase [Agathobacter sp.]